MKIPRGCANILVAVFLWNVQVEGNCEDIVIKDQVSGKVTAGADYNGNKECNWKLEPPNGKSILIINITKISCSKKHFKLVPPDIDYCAETAPFVVQYISKQCSIECNESNCYKPDEFKVEIRKKGNPSGFELEYKIVPCEQETTRATTTTQTTETVKTAGKPTTQFLAATTGLTTTQNTIPAGTELVERTTNSNSPSTPKNESSKTTLITVFVPITVILFVAIVVLLVFMRFRRQKLIIENKTENNQTGSSINELNTRAERSGFSNLAYETVLESNQDREYATIDDGAVYYSAVAESEDQPESAHPNQSASQAPTTHGYEEVTLEGIDDTPLRSEMAGSTDERVQVDNILYGENN